MLGCSPLDVNKQVSFGPVNQSYAILAAGNVSLLKKANIPRLNSEMNCLLENKSKILSLNNDNDSCTVFNAAFGVKSNSSIGELTVLSSPN